MRRWGGQGGKSSGRKKFLTETKTYRKIRLTEIEVSGTSHEVHVHVRASAPGYSFSRLSRE